jgi:hypothetical protein
MQAVASAKVPVAHEATPTAGVGSPGQERSGEGIAAGSSATRGMARSAAGKDGLDTKHRMVGRVGELSDVFPTATGDHVAQAETTASRSAP